MNEASSVISSLIDDDLKSVTTRNDTKAILLALLAQLVWAFNGVQLKSFFIFFPNEFNNASLTFYRSFGLISLGYYFAKKNNIEIIPISKVQNKFWFFTRNIGIFFSLLLWVIMNQYLRLSTCQCISGCNPVIVLYLSVFILKEKFHMRYLAGILFCLFGTCLIVLNEHKSSPSSPSIDDEKSQMLNNNNNHSTIIEGNVGKGVIIGIIQLLIGAAATFAQKFLINEKMGSEVQSYYLGTFQFVMGFIFMVLTNNYGLSNILYIFYCFFNGMLVYLGTYITTESLKLIPISKFMPTTYIGTVYVFILGCLVLGEPLYFSDIMGGSLIIGFQLYNIWVPIK